MNEEQEKPRKHSQIRQNYLNKSNVAMGRDKGYTYYIYVSIMYVSMYICIIYMCTYVQKYKLTHYAYI